MTEQEQSRFEEERYTLGVIIGRLDEAWKPFHLELENVLVQLRRIKKRLDALLAASEPEEKTDTGVRCTECGRRFDLDDKELTIHKPGCSSAPRIRVKPPCQVSVKRTNPPDRVVGKPLTTFNAFDDLIEACENVQRGITSPSTLQPAIERAKRSRLTATGDGEAVMQSARKEPANG